jgi:hypothetical protein
MRKDLKAEKAREAFTEAMASFQAECPIIEKTKVVLNKDGRTIRYKYAPLDSIVSQVRKPLADNGLAYSFDEKKDDKLITAICKVTHELGHFETSSFQVPIGTEDYMSDPQKHGARITFAKRYAFCNALGILIGDEDTDAVEETTKLPADMKSRIEAISTMNDLKDFYTKNAGLGKDFVRMINAQKKVIMDANKE